MRNLKRALSLTLASVMLLGMMVLGTSAVSYPDVTDEHNVEAIEVLQAVGVMSGSDSGNFNPDANVSRIEMAIVMSNLLNLKVDYFENQCTFTDVPEWAGKYVAACAASGIVSGVGGNRFGTSDVTATQAALMMLKALGYFQYTSDFGSNWAQETAKLAANLQLFKGIDAYDTAVLTRNQVAQLALNTLETAMVTPDDNTTNITITTGDATVNATSGSVKYVVRSSSDRKVATAISSTESNSNSTSGLSGWTVELGENLYQGDLVKRDAVGIADEFARPATEWLLHGEKIGYYNDEPDAVYTSSVKIGQIYKDLGLNRTIPASRVYVYVDGVEDASQKSLAIKSGDDDNKYGANGTLTQVFYDVDTDSVTITEINTYTGEIARNVAASGTKDAYVVISTESEISERPIGVSGNLNYETEETFETDTRVLYTYSQSTEDVMSVLVADSVEGTVTRAENTNTNDNDRKALTIEDQRYTASANSAGEKLGDVTVNSDYVVYLDAYGYIIYVEESEVAINNYALLINTASTSTFIGNRARLLFTDGTIKNVETEKNYNSGSDAIANYTIVTTRVDDDGVYTLKAVDATKSFKNAVYTDTPDEHSNGNLVDSDYADTFNMKSDKAGITVDNNAISYDGIKVTVARDGNTPAVGTTFNANSATAIVVADAGKTGSDSDFTSYVGIKNAPTVAATNTANQGVAAYWFCKNGKMITAMFVFPGSALEIEDTNNKLIYIAKDSVGNLIHDKDGDYFEYNAIVGTEIIEGTKVDGLVKTDGVASISTAATKANLDGLFKSYTVDKYGIVTGLKTYDGYGDNLPTNAAGDKEEVLVGTGIDKVSKDYTVILNTQGAGLYKNETITVDDAAKIYYVDKDGNISESSYKGISVDDDDIVNAVVKDFKVKTLVIQQVDTTSSANGVPATIAADKSNAIVGDTVNLTVTPTLGAYDEIDSYTWYKSNTSGLSLAAVEALTPIANANGRVYQADTSAVGTTYYYCVVASTNSRLSGVGKTLVEIAVVVKADPANTIGVVVSYKAGATEVDTEVIPVPVEYGVGTLTKDMLTIPENYVMVGTWSNKVVSSTRNEFDVAVAAEIKTEDKVPAMPTTKDEVSALLTDDEIAFADLAPVVSTGVTQTSTQTGDKAVKVALSGSVTSAATMAANDTELEAALGCWANSANKTKSAFESLYNLKPGTWGFVVVKTGDKVWELLVGEKDNASAHPWVPADAGTKGIIVRWNGDSVTGGVQNGAVKFVSELVVTDSDGISYTINVNDLTYPTATP